MALIRLDKYITDQGLCSRSNARDRVRAGTVTVNGLPVSDPAAKIDPDTAQVCVNGRLLNAPGHLYVMLHKPAGLLSASRDPRAPTVLDLMPEEWKRRGLFCVGRLDKDTTGLLLLSDDGDWAHRILSPKNGVQKLYEAAIDGTPTQEDVRAFSEGIVLKDGLHCLPANLQILSAGLVRVEVSEGKYHQVRRMLASRLLPVRELRRLRIGSLELDPGLAPGEFRQLSPGEEILPLTPLAK